MSLHRAWQQQCFGAATTIKQVRSIDYCQAKAISLCQYHANDHWHWEMAFS